MGIETTKLLTESVIVFVDAVEIVAVMLPALGLCLCAGLSIREAIRMRRGALDQPNHLTFTETDPVTLAYMGN